LQGSAIFDRPLLQNADPPQLEASQLASMSGPGVRDGLAGSVETHDRGISRAIVMMTRDGQNGETRLVEARECGHSLALAASGPRVAIGDENDLRKVAPCCPHQRLQATIGQKSRLAATRDDGSLGAALPARGEHPLDATHR